MWLTQRWWYRHAGSRIIPWYRNQSTEWRVGNFSWTQFFMLEFMLAAQLISGLITNNRKVFLFCSLRLFWSAAVEMNNKWFPFSNMKKCAIKSHGESLFAAACRREVRTVHFRGNRAFLPVSQRDKKIIEKELFCELWKQSGMSRLGKPKRNAGIRVSVNW